MSFMFFTFNFMLALKIALVLALTETLFPFAYEALRGFYLKNHFARHSNSWFRFIAVIIKTSIIYLSLQLGVGLYLVFPMVLFVCVGLQMIADDYIDIS